MAEEYRLSHTASEIDRKLSEIDNLGKVKTVNGVAPDESGNVNVEIPEVEIPEINYPVTSVNGMTGDIVIDIPSIDGLATEDYVDTAINISKELLPKVFYYSNLSDAITDINNNVTTNSITDIVNAKVKVFTADTGALTVMLLDDLSESGAITINKDIDLVLNGKTINLTTVSAMLTFATGTSSKICGVVNGSSIVKEVGGASANAINITVNGDLYIEGGRYVVTGSNTKQNFAIKVASSCNIIDIDGALIEIDNSGYAKAIQSQAKKTIVRNCTLNVDSTGDRAEAILGATELVIQKSSILVHAGGGSKSSEAVFNQATSTLIEESELSVTADNGDAYTILVGANSQSTLIKNSNISSVAYDGDAYTIIVNNQSTSTSTLIKDSNISSVAYDGNSRAVYNVYTDNPSTIIVKDSIVYSDAPNNKSAALYNEGIMYLENVAARGAYAAVRNGERMYINGGTYAGYARGIDILSYETTFINDATIECGYYEGEFDYSDGNIYACIDILRSREAYIDGCTFEPIDRSPIYINEPSSTGATNVVNISNLNITGTIYMSGTNHTKLNVGMNTNITTDMIGNPGEVTFTNELYRRQPTDKQLTGADYTALLNNTPPSVTLDTTLSQSGQAADAKAVGDALEGKQPIGDYALKSEIPSASSGIIDVVELPTDNIREDAMYRLLTAKWIMSGEEVKNGSMCYCVNGLPESGIVVTDSSMNVFIGYYNVIDNEMYGYVDDVLGSLFSVPAGWYTFNTLAQVAGAGFNGIMTDIDDCPINEYFGVLLSKDCYIYEDGWTKLIFAYEKLPKFDVTWDGDMTDRLALDMSAIGYSQGIYFVKVSDDVYTTDEVVGCVMEKINIYDGSIDRHVISSDDIDTLSFPGAFLATDRIAIVYSENDLATALGIPNGIYTNGVYFWTYTGSQMPSEKGYTSSFTSPNRVAKIDGEYVNTDNMGLHEIAFSGSWYDLNNRPTIYTDIIRYTATQNLLSSHKQIARTNIDVYSKSEVDNKIASIDYVEYAVLADYAKISEVQTLIDAAIGTAIGGSY